MKKTVTLQFTIHEAFSTLKRINSRRVNERNTEVWEEKFNNRSFDMSATKVEFGCCDLVIFFSAKEAQKHCTNSQVRVSVLFKQILLSFLLSSAVHCSC